MKRIIIIMVLISFITLSMTSCFGKFNLTKKIYQLNAGLGGNDFGGKFIKTIVMWAMYIIPVYPICGFVDIVVLNLIEFWTGSNPLTMNADETETRYLAFEGRNFEVITSKNRYDVLEISNPANTFSLVFDENSWYLHANNEIIKVTEEVGNETMLFSFSGDVLQVLPF
jgi:hypothetical protein